jgi:Domain of unknown function (DUF4124)
MNAIRRIRPIVIAGLLLPCVIALAASSSTTSGRKVYKWTDEKGVVHYGDQVPPEYSQQERHVVNPQGVEVDILGAQKTPEEIAAEEKKLRDAKLQRDRDVNLLNTYVSVQEIERLRDSRVTLLVDQVKVTNQFIEQLSSRMRKLQMDSMRYRPYSNLPGAQPMPAGLVDDLVRTGNDIRTQRQNLQQKQQEEKAMRENFARDIERFKQLKGIH